MNNKRPDVLEGKTFKIKTQIGSIYITVNYDNLNIHEIFINTNWAGNNSRLLTDLSRSISLKIQDFNSPTLVFNYLQDLGAENKSDKYISMIIDAVKYVWLKKLNPDIMPVYNFELGQCYRHENPFDIEQETIRIIGFRMTNTFGYISTKNNLVNTINGNKNNLFNWYPISNEEFNAWYKPKLEK